MTIHVSRRQIGVATPALRTLGALRAAPPTPARPLERPTLRLARDGEAEALGALLAAAYAADAPARRLAELGDQGALAFVVVAERAGAPVGVMTVAQARIESGRPLDVTVIADLGVALAARGRGVGAALVGAAVFRAQRRRDALLLARGPARLLGPAGFGPAAVARLTISGDHVGGDWVARVVADGVSRPEGRLRLPDALAPSVGSLLA